MSKLPELEAYKPKWVLAQWLLTDIERMEQFIETLKQSTGKPLLCVALDDGGEMENNVALVGSGPDSLKNANMIVQVPVMIEAIEKVVGMFEERMPLLGSDWSTKSFIKECAEILWASLPKTEQQKLRWHYGPTEEHPDPGTMIHYDCGGEVMFIEDGYICMKCGQSDPSEETDTIEAYRGIFRDIFASDKNPTPDCTDEVEYLKLPVIPDEFELAHDEVYELLRWGEYKLVIHRNDRNLYYKTEYFHKEDDRWYWSASGGYIPSSLQKLLRLPPLSNYEIKGNTVSKK